MLMKTEFARQILELP